MSKEIVMMVDNLNACPYCNRSNPTIIKMIIDNIMFYSIECKNCKAKCGNYLERNDAVESWNDVAEMVYNPG